MSSGAIPASGCTVGIFRTAANRSLLINRLRHSNIRKAVPMTDGPKSTFSRRGFLKGAGVTAATTVIESANALARETKDSLHHDRTVGPDAVTVKLDINGHEHSVNIEPRYTDR